MKSKLFSIIITAVCSTILILAAVAAGFYFGNATLTNGAGPPPEEISAATPRISESQSIDLTEESEKLGELEPAKPEKQETLPEAVVSPEESISIPGFEKIIMKARQLEQEVNFYNPQKNTCYFVVTLYLPDGTELFRSGLIAPGKSVKSIELAYSLEAETYKEAILRYSCYSTGDMQPLNGADITFALEVR